MNLDMLKKKNIGWLMEIVPPARHLDVQGNLLPDQNEDWLVEDVTSEVVQLSDPSGREVRLGPDHVISFATNPQHPSSDGKRGFLSLRVQVFIQGEKVSYRPNARPGEKVDVSAVTIMEKIVDLNYPALSGVQERLEALGYKLRWSVESKLARRLDIEGWEVVVEPDPVGRLFRFRCRDSRDDLVLIKKRI